MDFQLLVIEKAPQAITITITVRFVKPCESGGESPLGPWDKPEEFNVRTMNAKA